MLPGVYTGQANLTTLASRVTNAAGNGSMFEIVYHCQNCLKWDQNGQAGNVSTSNGGSALGRAAAKMGPSNAGCPSQISFGFHDNGYGQFTAQFANATSANYNTWAALPAKPVTLAAGCSTATNATRYVHERVLSALRIVDIPSRWPLYILTGHSTASPTSSSTSTATGTRSPTSSATSAGWKVGMMGWMTAGVIVAATWVSLI